MNARQRRKKKRSAARQVASDTGGRLTGHRLYGEYFDASKALSIDDAIEAFRRHYPDDAVLLAAEKYRSASGNIQRLFYEGAQPVWFNPTANPPPPPHRRR